MLRAGATRGEGGIRSCNGLNPFSPGLLRTYHTQGLTHCPPRTVHLPLGALLSLWHRVRVSSGSESSGGSAAAAAASRSSPLPPWMAGPHIDVQEENTE